MTAERGGRARRRVVAAICVVLLAAAVGGLMVPRWSPASSAAGLDLVANYPMDDVVGAATMYDAGPFGLDGSIGTLVSTGVVTDGETGYEWAYKSPDEPPVEEERLITVPGSSYLEPGTGAFGIEVKYRTEPVATGGNIVQKGQFATSGGYFKVEQNSGRITCVFKDAAGVSAMVIAPRATNDGAWHVVRCDLDADGIRMRVDGTQVDAATRSFGTISNSFDLTIGGKVDCNQTSVGCDYFSGGLGYVKIWQDLPGSPTTSTTSTTTTSTTSTTTTTTVAPSTTTSVPIAHLDAAVAHEQAHRGTRSRVP